MKRFLAALSALLVLALVSAGCNSASIPTSAARVDSLSITTAQLDAAMTALQGDAGYLCQGSGGAKAVTAGVGENTWNATFADFVLTQLIKFTILEHMVAAHNLQAPSSEISLATAEAESSVTENLSVLQQSTPPVTCPGTAATIISGLGPSFHTALLDNQVNQDLYSAYLAGVSLQPDALASWERSHAAAATQSCTSVIEVATDKVALKIEKAVINGASFATEATTYSQNSGTGSGGAVGCVLESQWTGDLGPVVGALTVGVVSKPVKYQSSWLLFDVTKRQLEPTTDVVPQIDSLESSAFNVQYSKALVAADISVSPVYGSVQRKAVQGGYSLAVVPPSSKACVYALSATAAGCVSTPTATTGSSG